MFAFDSSFTISVTAVVDEAILTVPSLVIGSQNSQFIKLVDANGTTLSAALFDTNAENGPESLSVQISGVPDGSRFSAGTLTGFGQWSIPVSALPTLEYLPPEYFAGEVNLRLTGFTIEESNLDFTSISKNFTVQINPIGDEFLILARNVDLKTSPNELDNFTFYTDDNGVTYLTPTSSPNFFNPGFANLELRMIDTRGFLPGEIPPEYVEATYTKIPDGVRMIPRLGGRLIDDGMGTVTFIGTERQANALFLVTEEDAIAKFDYFVDVSVVSVDGGVKSTPQTDNFRLSIRADDTVSITVPGTAGDDMLDGGIGKYLKSLCTWPRQIAEIAS